MWGGAQWKLEIGGSAQRNSSGQPPIYGWNYYPAAFCCLCFLISVFLVLLQKRSSSVQDIFWMELLPCCLWLFGYFKFLSNPGIRTCTPGIHVETANSDYVSFLRSFILRQLFNQSWIVLGCILGCNYLHISEEQSFSYCLSSSPPSPSSSCWTWVWLKAVQLNDRTCCAASSKCFSRMVI